MDFGRTQMGRRTNRRFNYRPMYYDADREDLQDRVKQAEMAAKGEYDPKGFEDRIRRRFRNQGVQSNSNHNFISGSKPRLLFIILVIGLMFYLTFYSRAFSVIFEAFYNA